MSHSTVLVTNTHDKSHDDQLERFNEQGDDGDYFMERDVEVEHDKYREALLEIAEQYDGIHKRKVDESAEAQAKLQGGGETSEWELNRLRSQSEYKDEYDVKAKATRKIAESDILEDQQTALQDWHGGTFDEDGNLYHISNPDARWDWYEVGGRWAGFFIAKDNVDPKDLTTNLHYSEKVEDGIRRLNERRTDVIKVKDIDWDAMKSASKQKAELNWKDAEGKDDTDRKWRYGIDKGMTKEQYIEQQTEVSTFAVLHNDEWFERGEMGWWGIVSDEKDQSEWNKEWKSLIESLDPEAEVTIVDVHI